MYFTLFFSAFLYWGPLNSALLPFSSEMYFYLFFNLIHYAQLYYINKIVTFKEALWLVKPKSP